VYVASVWQAFTASRKQRGLASLSREQGRHLGYGDSCYNGRGAVCGTDRLAQMGLRPKDVISTVERPNRGVEYGGGKAEVLRCVHFAAQIGNRTRILEVDVVRGCLPLLLSEGALHKFGLDIMTSRRQVRQGEEVLSVWSEGEMPAVQVVPVDLATVKPAEEGADAVMVGVEGGAEASGDVIVLLGRMSEEVREVREVLSQLKNESSAASPAAEDSRDAGGGCEQSDGD
jgi:hypothetical protein